MATENRTFRHREPNPCGAREHCEFAEEAADSAVKKVFAILGVDINVPEQVERFREDLRFGGKLRRAADHSILAFVGLLIIGIGAVMWAGVVAKLKGG